MSSKRRARQREAEEAMQARLDSRRLPQLEQIEMVAPMPHLPDELLLSVLSSVHSLEDGRCHTHPIPGFCLAQRDLADISLTCKLWHRIITQVLYQRPEIHSVESLTRLARTVSQNADLASMVKDLVLLCPKPKYSFQDPPGMSPSAMECIVSCTQLNSLTLGNQINKSGTFISPCADSKLYQKLATGHLSMLIITDSLAPLVNTASGVLRLPFLEELLLRRVAFPLSYSFPVLPKLHVLSLIECKMVIEMEVPQSPEISATSFPSLRSLHVHEAEFPIRLSPQLIRGLVDLTYFHIDAPSQEILFRVDPVIWGNTCNLRCMSTMALSGSFFPSSINLFPRLEKLIIVCPARDFTTCSWARSSKGFFTALAKLLKAGGMKSLKSIVAFDNGFPPDTIDANESSPIPALIHQCALRGVNIDVWYIPDIWDWISESHWEYMISQPQISEVIFDALKLL